MSAVPPTRFRQETRVAWRSIDGESVLIDPTSGTVFVLNRVGSQVWALLEEPRTVDDTTINATTGLSIGLYVVAAIVAVVGCCMHCA